jgi:hypothetical protein
MTATQISNLDKATDTLCRELMQDDRDLGEILFSIVEEVQDELQDDGKNGRLQAP